ncbi:excisionase [Variovorax sp. PAMC26660]|uniref:excisionase n=1 Tax=Variovorax sp. PAMC26660 TaxID=2762322 RepID=UPI00164D02DD|nr:excisionase [Variovorax sp. PAMC26660]QNK69473.1 excisionase [Variovorax sp. PAMC26660]
MSLKITLAAWAAQQFDPPPAERTLRLWVREGRIVPAPLKIGRAYYVEPSARHIAEVMADSRLVSRLRRG